MIDREGINKELEDTEVDENTKENKKEHKAIRRVLKFIAIILIIIIVILLLLRGCGSSRTPNIEEKPPIGNFEVSENQKDKVIDIDNYNEVPKITFAGYGSYTISKKNTSIELRNPEGNPVDMVFEVIDTATGTIIARTDKVKSGDYAYVNLVNFYTESGVYNVNINISTYDSESGAEMNGMNQSVEVKVQ